MANSEKVVLSPGVYQQNGVVYCSALASPLADGAALNVPFPI